MLGVCDFNILLVFFELYKIFIMQIIVFFMLYFMYLYFEQNIEFYFLVLLVNEIGKYNGFNN